MDALRAGHVQIAETLIKTYKVDNSIQWISNKTSFEMKYISCYQNQMVNFSVLYQCPGLCSRIICYYH